MMKSIVLIVALTLLSGVPFSPAMARDGQTRGLSLAVAQNLYDFIANAPQANWQGHDPYRRRTYLLGFGEATGEKGNVRWWHNHPVEDGSKPSRILETHPTWVSNGKIWGTFHNMPTSLQQGDRFISQVGFRHGAGAGDTTFKVIIYYEIPGWEFCCHVTHSIRDTYDGKMKTLEFEIPEEVIGHKITSIVLMVEAGLSSSQDWAVWEGARLERVNKTTFLPIIVK